MHLALSLAVVIASVLVGAFAFPPERIRLLGFVCLVPFFLVIRRGGLGQALFVVWFWAVFAAWRIATALPGSISEFFLQPAWVGWAFSLGIWTAMAAVYYMAFTPFYRAVARRPHPGLPLVVAAGWVAVELARGRLFTGTPFFIGNPWGLLGYSLAGPGPAAQIAAVTGVYGLSFALVAANAAIAELLVALRDRSRNQRTALRGLAVGFAPALIVFVYGGLVLRGAPAPSTGEGFVPISVVQGNVPLVTRWRSDFYGQNLDIYLRLTQRSFSEGAPQVVFWPEAAFTFFLETEPAYRRAIGRVLSRGGAELVAGGPSGDGDADPPYFNSIFVVSESGAVAERYDKELLVPFTEFFPLRGLDLLRRRFEGARNFAHGAPRPPLETRAGRAGILTCNEAMLPEVAARRVRDGAQYLVNPSNDSWIADRRFAEHMFDIVALRAVEQRRYLVRVSTSGPSAVVDPWGRVPVRTEPLTRHLLLGRIRPESGRSIYSRVGDLFAGLCTIAAGGALALEVRRRRTAARRA